LRGGRGHSLLVLCAATAVAYVAVPGTSSGLPADPTQPAARDTEPVVMTGKDFVPWSTASNATAKAPATDLTECQSFDEKCKHNNYAKPEVDSQEVTKLSGTPVDRLLGYRWDARRDRFVQIPFQVDEVFTRYLDNSASGFSVYSGQDRHTTYAFDREGFRYTKSDPDNPCLARPDSAVAKDPVPGLDDDDELAFMAGDAGTEAPGGANLPRGIDEARSVRLVDPTRPDDEPRFVYVMKTAERGPTPAFTSRNGYVRYERDQNADLFEKSESSYDGYGNAARGPVCDAEGNVIAQNERRRPRDYATVSTGRYRFRYDGRWLMTQVQIARERGRGFGPDVVDRWKARAFQQDPSSETPCCGYEEEDTNWGGSSTLLGERVGPVRAIRETWGADSGTNVIRRETFYRDEVRQKSYLRVHVIPPLDGIYAQWDFNAGRMTRYYTSARPDGVPIDGRNDEVAGNLDDPCNGNYDEASNPNDTSAADQGYRNAYRSFPGLCGGEFPYHQSVDVADPTLGELNSGLQWSVTAGPHGTIVDRYQIDRVTDLTPGGAVQNVAAVPYYRDDSCFDDGTGTDPGPRVKLRSTSEPRTYTAADGSTQPRRCWAASDGLPDGSQRHFQGSIGTHGLHILFLAESDNARMTVPLTEIVGEQRLVMLKGERDGSVGEAYGRGFEKPLVTVSLPAP
jgi:hypothetical protein